MQQALGYLKIEILFNVSAAFEKIVQGEKINNTQRKVKYIHTRNRNATWIAKCWRINILQIRGGN